MSANIDALPIEKLGYVRKYFFEFVVMCLIACVGYLFTLYVGMNNKLQDYLNTDKARLIEALQENTNVLRNLQNTIILKSHTNETR